MRLLVLCPKCQRQYDAAGRPAGNRFRCHCGEVVTVQAPRGHDAEVVRCSSCGAPRTEGSSACSHCGADFTLRERDLDTVCPHCLARVSDRARFCHHCGRPLLPEPVVAEASALLCPACGAEHTLSSRRMADVNVLECGRCAGLWLGRDTLDVLMERAVAERWSPRARARPPGPPPIPLPGDMPPIPGRFYRACPFCKGLMPRHQLAEQSGVVVDLCREHGLWFDSEELPRMLEWVRRGGQATLPKRRIPDSVAAPQQASEPTSHVGDIDWSDWEWLWMLALGLASLVGAFFGRR